jgi:pimeloyl-ACP methyl ester carboxylesterase
MLIAFIDHEKPNATAEKRLLASVNNLIVIYMLPAPPKHRNLLSPVITLLALVLMWPASAIATGSHVTGFWGDTGASPKSGAYDGTMPPLQIDSPATATVIIYIHGTTRPQRRENCEKSYNVPPKSLTTLASPTADGTTANSHIYFLCSTATDDGSAGSYIFKRARELRTHLDLLTAAGVKPRNIFVAGHSAGGWTALMAMSDAGTRFNAAIVFAPACCGPRKEESRYPIWRQKIRPFQISRITATAHLRVLVFAYNDDPFNRPQDLGFLTAHDPAGATLVGYDCGHGHATHRFDCRLADTKTMISAYIAARKADF